MVLRCHRTLRSLCKAHLCDRRWSDDELCEPAEVLRDCRQCELELSTTWSTQAQTTEPKDTLEMCKQHLNTFAIATRSLECFGFGHRPCHVTGLLVEASLDSAERSLWAALCLECADGEMNFGVTSLAAPNAASSSVARYSLVARLTARPSSSLFHCEPGVDRCLLASATIRLASTAKPSPPTKPAPMHAPTTRSNTLRKMSLSRNRSLRARENAE